LYGERQNYSFTQDDHLRHEEEEDHQYYTYNYSDHNLDQSTGKFQKVKGLEQVNNQDRDQEENGDKYQNEDEEYNNQNNQDNPGLAFNYNTRMF
jgi:hypothetical protein